MPAKQPTDTLTATYRRRSRTALAEALTAAGVGRQVTADVVAVWRNAATLVGATRPEITQIADVDVAGAVTIQKVAATLAGDATVHRYNRKIAEGWVTYRQQHGSVTPEEGDIRDVYTRQVVCDRYAAYLRRRRRPHASQRVAALRQEVATLAGRDILTAFDAAVAASR